MDTTKWKTVNIKPADYDYVDEERESSGKKMYEIIQEALELHRKANGQ